MGAQGALQHTHTHTHARTHARTHVSDRGVMSGGGGGRGGGEILARLWIKKLEIVIKQVRPEGSFERGGRIRVAECLRQIVSNRRASVRKRSFTK